jgi:hypothetical protein
VQRPSIALCYKGSLTSRKEMPEQVRLAYEAFCGMKARSKKNGFPVPDISAREFVGWWLNELQTFKGTIPTCGRIDHSKGYSWDNFKMQDMAENSRENAKRIGLGQAGKKRLAKRVNVYIKGTDTLTGIFPTIRSCARFFKVSQRQVQFLIRGDQKACRFINFDLRGAV